MDAYSFVWWFGTIPLYNATTLRLYFIGFLSLIIVGALVRMVSKRRLTDHYQIEITKRLASLFVVMGVVGLWYWFVAGQQVPFLSARFWLPVIGIVTLWWLWTIVRFARKDVPVARVQMHELKDETKYFEPKRKK
ncbi:TPA: hypothetical protein DEB00_03050 [Candidatus Uhrbacteria bacterium]|nr:hypothetical protein [Candidatus Uhrbacteria bacterium]